MASARFAWGIDIGNRALKAVKLVRDGDQLRVDDFDLIEHEHVLSNAGDNKDSLIQTALMNFVQKHPMKKGGVVSVGVSGQSSFARFIKLPPVETKKIPEIVKFEAIQQIPFPLDDVEWSYQLFSSAESPDVEVGIFAMRKDLISHQIKFFTDVDMNIQVVQMSPLAVYNAMYYDQRLKGTTMIIDLGAENTDLIICDNDSVWLRSIPIGGNNFTETLVKAFKLPFAKAEDLKRNAATSKYARQIFQAMRPVFADLVAEIQRSVGFYASVHRDSRIKKIIALGGTFRLPGLQKYLQQNLSLDVERLDNLAAGAPADPKLAATFNENLLSVIGAYGLAAQAMGEGKITSSLLPTTIRRAKMWKEKTKWFGAAAACFCIGTGVAYGGYLMQKLRFDSNKEKLDKVEAIQTEAEGLNRNWGNIEGSGASDRLLITNVQKFERNRELWPRLLREIQNAVPKPQPEIIAALQANPIDVSAMKKIPREERKMVTLTSILSAYAPSIAGRLTDPKDDDLRVLARAEPDPNTPLADPVIVADLTGDPNAAQAGEGGKRGFIITIYGSTTYGQYGDLIEKTFIPALLQIKPDANDPKKEYSIRKAIVKSESALNNDDLRKQDIKRVYDAQRSRQAAANAGNMAPLPATPAVGRGMPMGGAANPATPVVPAVPLGEEQLRDRLIPDETRANDTDFVIVLLVELNPEKYTPQTAGDARAAAQ